MSRVEELRKLYPRIIGSDERNAAGQFSLGEGKAHKRFLFDFLTGNCCRPIPWQGFSCKGQTKSKAPAGECGGLGITVRNLIQTGKR